MVGCKSSCCTSPSAVYRTSLCVAASLVGDSALYVVLPVVFVTRGLTPLQVGLILSANRWTRLFTNAPAARLLGSRPVRTVFASALLLGGLCSFVYCVPNVAVLVVARATRRVAPRDRAALKNRGAGIDYVGSMDTR